MAGGLGDALRHLGWLRLVRILADELRFDRVRERVLDEVDAPLDDANVQRYVDMVKEMSRTVQFIFITHNKIAMEMGEQLMGVTMHEPGVSRLVAVDVDEAVAMAAV